jgi:parallel beta-helix repeat protein
LRLDLTCQRNRIVDNEFTRLGAVAILLAGYPPGTKDVNHHNHIINNWVHHTGEIYQATPAIMVCQSGHNRIANNLIHNTPYSGIALSGRDELDVTQVKYQWYEWYQSEKYYHARQNQVEHNEIHHVMETMGDGNGIYVSGCGKENHIFQNLIHDCVGRHMGAAIRCDDIQNETIVEGNVIHHIGSVQTGISVTGRNHLLNNVIVDIFPSPRVMGPGNIVHGYISLPATFPYGTSQHAMDLAGMRIERNIVLSPRKDYLPVLEYKSFPTGPGDRLKGTKTDRNLYWCPEDPLWGERYLEAQQAEHVERHSRNADPLFLNWKEGDLRLDPRSPAWQLGFRPVDISRIGLLADHPYHENRPPTRP